MSLIKRLFIISLVILSTISNGCSTTNSTSYVSDGILFQLSTDKMHYRPEEDVLISAYVENPTAEDFSYTTPSGGPPLTVTIKPPDESGIAVNHGYGEEDCLPRLSKEQGQG